jgi:hypothetical protein
MNRKITTPLLVVAASTVFALIMHCSSPVAGNGSGIGNGKIASMLYNPGGTPAVGVVVYIRPDSTLADTSLGLPATAGTDSTVTDNNGNYSFDTSLDAGTYVIEAASGNNAVLIDSVVVTNDHTPDTLPPDTLKPAGAIKGIVYLSEGGDPRKVFVLAFGIDRFTSVNADGSFRFSALARGNYNLRLISSLDDYDVLDTVGVPVLTADTTNLDTLRLPFTGIPTPKNVAIIYDTLKQIVTLTWSKADTSLVKGYNVYRRDVDSSFGTTPMNGATLVRDTVFRDSSGIEEQTYEYKVIAIDKGDNAGKLSTGDSVNIQSAFPYLGLLGTAGTAIGQYNNPIAVAATNEGKIMVADYDSGKVLLYDSTGAFLREYRAFNYPISVVPSNQGSFYVLEGQTNTIKHVDSSGNITSTFGGIGSSQGQFSQTGGWQMAISPGGSPYVTDPLNNRIQVFDSLGNYKREFAYGWPLGIAFIYNNEIAVASALGAGKISIMDTNGISQKEWDGWGQLITTKANNIAVFSDAYPLPTHISFYSSGGELIARFGHNGNDQNGFQYLRYIAIDNARRIYIADNDGKKVKIFSLPFGI